MARTHGKDTATIIAEIQQHHGDSLLYDRVDYKNCNTKITLGCKVHGYFEKYPNDMKQGRGGCPRCNNSFVKTHAEFVNEIAQRYPDIDVNGQYQNAKTKIPFYCKTHKHHFDTTPNQMLSGHNQCPECAAQKTTNTKLQNSQSVIDPALKSDFENYKRAVWRYSNRTYKKSMSEQTRDRQNHLDHILSIIEGFKNNVPAEVMGSIHNLRIMNGQANRHKSYRSDITVEDLMEKFNK